MSLANRIRNIRRLRLVRDGFSCHAGNDDPPTHVKTFEEKLEEIATAALALETELHELKNPETSHDISMTTHEVAKALSVSASAVLTWMDDGKLKGHRTPGGHRRTTWGQLLQFCEKFSLPTPTFLR